MNFYSRVTRDGSQAVVGYADGEDYTEDAGTFRVYDTETWEATGEFAAPEDGVEDLLYSRDGSELYVLQNDVTVTDEEGEEDTISRVLRLDPATGETLGEVELEFTDGDAFASLYLTSVVEQ